MRDTRTQNGMDRLIYEKYGTRVSELDEGERMQRFVFDGTKALAEAKGWELLPGAFERVPVTVWDGEQVFAYLWPVAREKNDFDRLDDGQFTGLVADTRRPVGGAS